MSYFAAALSRTDAGWTGRELELADSNLETVADELRDLTDGPGPSLLLLEEEDEYVGIVRVDGDASSMAEPRVFLSDRRAVQTSDLAALLWQDADPVDDDEAEDESIRPVAEPVGDTDILADLGTPAEALLGLCAEEGLLPADVLTTVCERAGCADVLENLREG